MDKEQAIRDLPWPRGSRFGSRTVRRLLGLPLDAITLVSELLVSRRGLGVGFLLVALAMTRAGWLRPPLTVDISAWHLPAGVLRAEGPSSEEILNGTCRTVHDSLGLLLSLLLIGEAAAVLWRPQYFGIAAGLLLCASLAANAAAALNHPALIESLDYEYEQRRQLAPALAEAPVGDIMVTDRNARLAARGAPDGDEQRGDWTRGWAYLLYGRWLVGWALAGTLVAGSGRLARRLGTVSLWLLLGGGLACAACGQRLTAEYCWLQAERLEGQGDWAASRQALEEAIARFPEFERLERTWLLAGKLDHQSGRATPEARFFQAYQLARDKEWPRTVAYREDLPWVIPWTSDYRSGVPKPSSFDLTVPAGIPEVGTWASVCRPSQLQGPLVPGYQFARRKGPYQALAHLHDLLAEGNEHPAVKNQAARLWTAIGLGHYRQQPGFTDGDPALNYYPQDRHLTAAQDSWRRALDLTPGRRDCGFYLGLVQARTDRDHPERVEAAFRPMVTRLADQILLGDILNTVGNAYFEAGQVIEARRRYAHSYDVFCLPKAINLEAQKQLGGM